LRFAGANDGRVRPIFPCARFGPLIAALLCLGLSGCGPKDPLDAKIDAADSVSFNMWRSHAAGRLTSQQLGDLDHAIQGIRFRVMSVGQTTGSEEIEAATLKIVDGRSVREVLRTGLGWSLQLAEAERAVLEDSLRKNAQMTTRPGDTASANYLSDLHERQVARLEAATEEVARIRASLAAAGLPTHPAGSMPRSP